MHSNMSNATSVMCVLMILKDTPHALRMEQLQPVQERGVQYLSPPDFAQQKMEN